jgi:DNA (cytosine-5)-methyltransferase 1
MQLKILDLFSGIGGFSLGLERTGNFKTVAFCEIDKFCTLILQKHWKGVKIYNDVKEIKKERLEADGIESPDVITGGFPCQPFSVAGKQKGTDDNRHLWPEMFRIIQEFTPRWVVGENVKGLTNIQDGMVFETVCTDLEGAGYEVRTFNIPACSVGAPHRRERMWIVAHSSKFGCGSRSDNWEGRQVSNNEARQFTQDQSEQQRWESRSREEGNPWSITESRTNQGNEFRRQDLSGSKNVENSRRSIRGEQSSRDQESIGPGTSEKTEWSTDSSSITGSSEGETIMADSNSGRSHEQNNEIQTGRNIPISSSEDVANAERQGLEGLSKQSSSISGEDAWTQSRDESRSRTTEDVADTESSLGNDIQAVAGTSGSTTQEVSGNGSSVRGESAWWDIEPDVGRVAYGLPGRVHRLKGLGNSIIPQIAQEIGNAIIKAEGEE